MSALSAICSDARKRRIPVSVKAVLVVDRRVLLVRNHRGEWELPGGRPDQGESLEDAVARELREETGLDVRVGGYIDWWDYSIEVEQETVRVVSFSADCVGACAVELSDEHIDCAWHRVEDISDLVMPDGYKRSIASLVGVAR